MANVHIFSAAYRPVQDGMNFLYSAKQLAATIAYIGTLEADAANGKFLVGKFTKLLMDHFLPHQSASVDWSSFDTDFRGASGKAQALSDFLRNSFFPSNPNSNPLPIVYETIVLPAGSKPDVAWGFGVDPDGNTMNIRVTYFCTS